MLGVSAAVSHAASNSNAYGASTTSIFIRNSTHVLNSALYHIMFNSCRGSDQKEYILALVVPKSEIGRQITSMVTWISRSDPVY